MVDPKQINIAQLPKKLCDGALGAHNKEAFFFSMTSGNSLDSFAATPQIMKSISVWMNKQVEDYEKKFGVIDMTPPDIQSPLQIADLKDSK